MQLQRREEALAAEHLPRACDLCHAETEVRWLDQDTWACARCARLYLALLGEKG